jgi:hypothetical protein
VEDTQACREIAGKRDPETDLANPFRLEGGRERGQLGVQRARRMLQPDRRGKPDRLGAAEGLDE